MRKSLSEKLRHEIIELYLNGEKRDDVARKLGVSAGAVSGVINEYVRLGQSQGVEEASARFGVTETVDDHRELGCRLRKANLTVEKASVACSVVERVKTLVPLERLEEFVEAGESLKDPAHVEAAIRLYRIETEHHMTHGELLKKHEDLQTKVQNQDLEIQRNDQAISQLKTEKENIQKDFESERARLKNELDEQLNKHHTSMQAVTEYAPLLKSVSDFGIDLSKLEQIQNVLCSVQQAGGDAKKLVEALKERETLATQLEVSQKTLTHAKDETARLKLKARALKKEIVRRSAMLKALRELEEHGWTTESLSKAKKFTRLCGNPEEVLARMELSKSSRLCKRELEKVEHELSRTRCIQAKLTEQNLAAARSNMQTAIVTSDSHQKNALALASAYNALAEKHVRLLEECDQLGRKCIEYKTYLDNAMSWTTIINEPTKLSVFAVNSLFDFLLPQLRLWMNSRSVSERKDVIGRVLPALIATYREGVARFLEAPTKVGVSEAIETVLAYLTFVTPFRFAIKDWSNSHEQESRASGIHSLHYYLDKLYIEGLQELDKGLSKNDSRGSIGF